MAVEFLKRLHQVSLEKAWNARAPKDPMPKRRQNVIDRIDAALAQLKRGERNPLRGNYQTRENFSGVRVQLKYGQRALVIDGRDHWFVEDAATFFSMARKAVQGGELDGAINDARDAKKDKAGTVAAVAAEPTPAPVAAPVAAPAPATAAATVKPPADIGASTSSVAEALTPPAPKITPPAPAKPDDEQVAAKVAASADEAPPRKLGKYAQRYEQLLSAGAFSESPA